MKKMLALSLGSILFFSCKKNDIPQRENNYAGFIYTSTNSTSGNSIIALGRHQDGTVEELKNSPYSTGGNGDAAEGDFDTQWALRIVGDYLLAVNAGGNPVNSTISVFKIDKGNGKLTQVDQNPATPVMDNTDSRGVRAASITYKTLGETTWVVVGNQFANPNYQGSPAVAFGTVVSTPARNVAIFNFNQASGILSYKSIGATFMDGNRGGPTTVEFNETGTKIAVSTWGVPHFAAPDADLNLQKPGRLYIYDFAAGNLAQTGMFEETGVSGNIGFSWSPNGQYIYLSNFNLHSSKEANSLTVHNGTTGAKVQNFATAGRNDEGCWTWLSLDKSKLYVASFGENVISSFSVLSSNLIAKTLEPNFFKRRGELPMGDTKDMHEAGGYLYVSGAFQSHTVSIFKTSSSGRLDEIAPSPYFVPTSKGKSKEEHAYLGFTGFNKMESNKKESEGN
ncbi:MAG: hypothetical protein H7122_02665 [Chitinophagaceae bacterium]|nr:hypothetical protein [Chitinophagaceae bacterium]